MDNKPTVAKEKIGADPKITAISLVVIFVQSLIIIFGFLNRWDWIVYEFAAMLIIPALIILYYGIKATANAMKIMEEERHIEDGLE